MVTINEQVIEMLNSFPWTLATGCGDNINAIPVMFKTVTPDGKLAVAQVFMATTIENIKHNKNIAVSVFDPTKVQGYQIKGTAEYIITGPLVDKFKEVVEEKLGALGREHGVEITAQGVVLITPTKITVSTPGPQNKKEV